MRFQFSIAILAALPSALSDPFTRELSTIINKALPARAAEPVNVAPGAPSMDTPYFMVTGFNAYTSLPGSDSPYSGAKFDLRLMHPQPARRWTTKCSTLTNETLCDAKSWRSCILPGRNAQETLMFKLDKDMSRVNIRWHWNYKGQWLTTLASEPATWVKKIDEEDMKGNMSVNPETISYMKPEGWVFAWRQTWS